MAGAERWLAMQAQSHSKYPRASHDSIYTQEMDENRTPPAIRRTTSRRSQALNGPSKPFQLINETGNPYDE